VRLLKFKKTKKVGTLLLVSLLCLQLFSLSSVLRQVVLAEGIDRSNMEQPVVIHQMSSEESMAEMSFFSILSLTEDLNLGFENDLNGWTTNGSVSVSENTSIVADTNTWDVFPKNNKMAVLQPSGATTAFSVIADTLRISTASRSYFLSNFPSPTNFAYIYKDISLTAGQIYYVAWNYVATDYEPYNDASFFTLTNTDNPSVTPTINGITTDVSLLGATVLGTGNYSTGSYGSTGWQSLSFKANETGSYRIGFVAFNLDDTVLPPVLFVDDGPGIVYKNGDVFEPIGEDPNAPPPPVPDTTPPSLSAVAVSRTSDTSATVKFTTDENGSYYYAVVEDGASVPTINTDGTGTSCTTGEVTITNPVGLSAGAKDIYIKVKDSSGNVSDLLKIDIAAFQSSKSSQTITFNALPTKTYGDADFTLSATASSGLPVTFSSSDSSIASINDASVTMHKQGVVTITASQAGNASYYEATAQQTLTIQKRSLQVINTVVAVKVYDGTTTATLSGSELQGVVSGDDVLLSQATTGTFSSASAGEQKTVTTQFALSGTDSDNYSIEQPLSIKGDISKRPVTITADAQTKVYGNSDPALTYQITEGNLVFQDAFTGALTRAAGQTVGNYEITQGSVALNDNYTLSYVKGNLEISKRPVTISADAKTKVYGNNDPALTYQITAGNLVYQDAFTGTPSRDADENVGYYDITRGSVVLSDNYALSFNKGTFEITKRPVTITADNKTKVYGENDPALTYQIIEGNLVYEDAFTGTPSRDADENVGYYDITRGSVVLSDNYALTFNKGTFEITKRAVTITADNKTKVYGENDPALTYQITEGNLVYEDAFTGMLSRASGDNVGYYDITRGSVVLSDNYALTYNKGTFEITKRPITITADAKTKVYGGNDPALTYQITEGNLVYEDAFTGALTRAADQTVGNYDITQGSVALNNNYTLSYVKSNLEITKRPVTLTADAKTKVYGNNDPALTYQITEGNLVYEDAITGMLSRATGDNVGSYDIAQGTVALSDNYALTFNKGTFEITKRPVAITTDAKTKVYGENDPKLTYQVTEGNLVFEDAFVGTLSRAVGQTVGNYEITQGSVALNDNYTLSYVKGNLEITKRPVTITADAKTKVYGENDSSLTYQVTEGNLVYEDAFVGTLSRAVGQTVGNYDITQGTVALSDNYDLSFNKGTFEITKRPVAITADTKTKVYGEENPALTYQITEGNLVYEDAFVGTLSRAEGETVGNYDITQGTVALSDNYALSFVKGNLEITKRTVTITADAKTKVYGEEDPALTYQITEGNLVFQDAFTGALTRAADQTVGNYEITQGSVALTDNYTLSYVKGNLEITKRPVTITADAKTKVYGENDPELTYQITAGDLVYQDAFTGMLSRATGENVGNYDITQGSVALSDNYALTFNKGTFEITKRSITITADTKAKVYGEDDSALTYQVTEGNLVYEDAFTGMLSRATGENVGNYDITQGTVALSDNYALSYVKGNLEITKRPVTITADVKTKVYGENDPTLTYQITEGSLVYEDTFTGALSRDTGETVGNYDITQGTVALSDNYALSYVKGNLEINQRPITITADAKTKVYGEEDPALTYQVTEGNLVYEDAFTGMLSRATSENVGNYDITQGNVALSDNYALSFNKGTFEITKRPVTITADAKTKVYGENDSSLTYQVTTGNLVYQDVFTGELTREVGETFGNYDITQGSVALNNNYTLSYVNGNLEITKRPVIITADAKTKVYGENDPALTYQITEGNLVYEDAFVGTLSRAEGENVCNYDITLGTVALSDNYALSFNKGTFEITKRPVTITADTKTKVYGENDPALTYQITEGNLVYEDEFVGTLTREAGDAIGNYDIIQGNVALNYNYALSYVKGNLEITKRPVTITADAKTKVYGDDDPALTYQITEGNLVYQDVFTGALARAAGENVGTYEITRGSVALSDNYALSYVKGNLEITKRPVIITADSQGKVYGTADPSLTYRITEGTLAYEDVFTGGLDRDYGEDVGNYLIQQGSLSLDDNYTLIYHLSSLEISPRSITITMDEIEKIENDPDPEFTYQLTSGQLIGSDYLDGTLSRDPGELPGSYRINEGTLSAGPNYEITFITATLSIQPMPVLQNKDNVEVIINGNIEQIGKQTVVEDDLGEETLLLTVDSEQALKRIEELQQQPNENESSGKNTFIVPITEGTSTNVKVNLTGDVIKNLEEGEFDVQIQSGNITYNVPAQEFSIMNVANQMNVPEDQLRSIEIETSISPVSEAATTAFRNFVEDNNDVLVFPPVSFHIEAKTYKQDGSVESVPITRFNNYVNRTIELPENTDPKLVTTGIIFHADGSYSHVPTTVYQLDGKWFATINSLTNSEYALIYRSITVPSVMNHWSKATVEEMASRLVLTNPESFEPDLNVTRAEFADYVVRALGLFRKESIALSTFSDIGTNNKHYLVIEIAHRYGIINGYLDGTFLPNQLITREEAMAMYSRAMNITKLPEEEPERCNEFEDFTQVSQWAVPYVKNVVAAKVFNGTSSTTLSPNSFLTHAESLTAIRNLLAKSSLINQ